MLKLFTTLYDEKNEKRFNELLAAISKNIALKEINEIYILYEGGDLSTIMHSKLTIIPITERPTYKQFFELINKTTNTNDINIIANTDISFDENIGVLNHIELNNSCIALSRWERQENNSITLLNRNDSQDTWIFKGKIKPVQCDFPLGVPRCDNRILFELKQAGYKVLNPAYSIKTYHHHTGKRTAYSSKNLKYFVKPPYQYLYPHNLFGLSSTIWFNFTHKYKLAPYCYDIKKINKWYVYRLLRKVMEMLLDKKLPLIGITEK